MPHRKKGQGSRLGEEGSLYHTHTPPTRKTHTHRRLVQRPPPTLLQQRNFNTDPATRTRKNTVQTMPTKAGTLKARTRKARHVTNQPSVNPPSKHRKTPNQPSTQKSSCRGPRPMGLKPLPHVHEKTNGSPPPQSRGHLLFPSQLDHSWPVRGLVPNQP